MKTWAVRRKCAKHPRLKCIGLTQIANPDYHLYVVYHRNPLSFEFHVNSVAIVCGRNIKKQSTGYRMQSEV